MDSIINLLQKIEQPLNFASKDNYKNLFHIKDLGKSLLNLLSLLKSSPPPSSNNDFSGNVEELLEIFSDYDWQKVELKKNKIEKAKVLLEKLKNVINSSSASDQVQTYDQQIIQRISDLKEALAKLNLPVQYLKGVGPKMATRFAAKKIATVEDLLYFLPRTYEDRREIRKINRLEVGKIQTITGKVINTEARYYGKKRILEVTVGDNTANLTAKWFKGSISYLVGTFKKGTEVIFTGNVTPNYSGKTMIHPEYEILDEDEAENLLNFKRIVPIYSETEGQIGRAHV
jgi:ATP-dependent DNA helicase RecG